MSQKVMQVFQEFWQLLSEPILLGGYILKLLISLVILKI